MGRLAGALQTPWTTTVGDPPSACALSVAVVIPTLNEASSIAATLRSLNEQTQRASRIVVSDAGSADGAATVVQSLGATVLQAPRAGRGCQIAHAVERLDEDIVVVAHADMIFPTDAIALIRQALQQDSGCPGGCLGHRFDRRSFGFRVIERVDRWRARRRGIAYGDQAQFFRRELIAKGGGFPDLPLMEDIELSRRLLELGRPIYLDRPVTVSSRHYARHGIFRTAWNNYLLRRAYHRGGPSACAELHRRYYAQR